MSQIMKKPCWQARESFEIVNIYGADSATNRFIEAVLERLNTDSMCECMMLNDADNGVNFVVWKVVWGRKNLAGNSL